MSKLILVSNRLPVTVELKKDGKISYSPSPGGLATGLSSLAKTRDCVFLGFNGVPGDSLNYNNAESIRCELIDNYKSYSVPLTSNDVRLYYNGFSNKTLWPLFHYFSLYTTYESETWKAYVKVNQKFYESLESLYETGDLIWAHDYHLMLLPGIIRNNIPDARVGFFLHIPFPSYEIFRLLPWRKEILEGLLGSDLIGFHTFGYVRHFLNSVQRIMGIEHYLGQLQIENRSIKCDIFPMGIDYKKYSDYFDNSRIKKEVANLVRDLQGRKLILSMDRLDFTKGIIERLNAYARFLEKYPEYHGKVIMIHVSVPSRTKVDTYISLRDRVNELIGRINGKYNTLNWSPIRYLYRSLPFETIMTLYHCADVALVTPLRDGMNLIAKEYVASRIESDGVLILSEMAGAAEELGEAIIVNPNNSEEVADAIAAALAMDREEQQARMSAMQMRLKRKNVFKWAEMFAERIASTKINEPESLASFMSPAERDGIMRHYCSASTRLLLLDYDGTLVPFYASPSSAVPDSDLLSLLEMLVRDTKNTMVLISGRGWTFLDRYFSTVPIILVAEHGALIKMPGNEWRTSMTLNNEWKQQIRPLLELYSDMTPGSFVEEKEHSLVWHYRKSDSEFAHIRTIELKSNLMQMIANLNLGIIEGNKVIEVRNLESTKGKIASHFMEQQHYDFILGIGDDVTDEDLFAVMPESSHSIKVGHGPSKARYHIMGTGEVRQLLKQLASGK